MRPSVNWFSQVRGCSPEEVYGLYALGTFALAFHYEMVSDHKRVTGFRRAIEALIRPTDVVVDIGTGSGILALMAGKYAARVYGVELDHSLASIAAENFRQSPFHEKFTLIVGDATELNLPEDVDVILCEMMDTVLLNEPQVPVLRSVRRRLRPGGRIIPGACRTEVELVACDFQPVADVPPMLVAHYERADLPNAFSLTDMGHVFTADFTGNLPDEVEAAVTVTSHREGTANAIRLFSTTILAPGIEIDACPTLNSPIVIPLKESVHLVVGQQVTILIGYRHFSDFRHFRAQIRE